jgi:hypothetical protein
MQLCAIVSPQLLPALPLVTSSLFCGTSSARDEAALPSYPPASPSTPHRPPPSSLPLGNPCSGPPALPRAYLPPACRCCTAAAASQPLNTLPTSLSKMQCRTKARCATLRCGCRVPTCSCTFHTPCSLLLRCVDPAQVPSRRARLQR